MLKEKFLFLLSWFVLCSTSVHGLIRFANYYHDHMVLQRAPQRAIVWGYTNDTNARILLFMNNKIYEATKSLSANQAETTIWSVELDAQTEEGPFQVKVSAKLPNGTIETLVLDDVLFGDVWFCSGQSNMEFSLGRMLNSSIEIQNANKYPKIRLMTADPSSANTTQEEPPKIVFNWSIASNVTTANGRVSAVCWMYGRMIHEALSERPIGLIHSSVGGTNIEQWTPAEVLQQCNITSENKLDGTDMQLYNAMVYPFTRMTIKGAIWYQGESNGYYNLNKYNCTLPKMIEAWRSIWHSRTNSSTDSQFPFGVVQISTYVNNTELVGGFPWVRWHQTFDVGTLPNRLVPNVFMAVTLDLRDDVGGLHPRTKYDVGYRLSRSGLAVAYGYKNITYLGPIIGSVTVASDSSKVNVTYTSEASPTIELRNSNGFEVCCASAQICNTNDAMWVPTPASRIEGTSLSISLAVPSSCISKPLNGLRYLWRTTPCVFKQAAVYNSIDSDLPAPPYIHYF